MAMPGIGDSGLDGSPYEELGRQFGKQAMASGYVHPTLRSLIADDSNPTAMFSPPPPAKGEDTMRVIDFSKVDPAGPPPVVDIHKVEAPTPKHAPPPTNLERILASLGVEGLDPQNFHLITGNLKREKLPGNRAFVVSMVRNLREKGVDREKADTAISKVRTQIDNIIQLMEKSQPGLVSAIESKGVEDGENKEGTRKLLESEKELDELLAAEAFLKLFKSMSGNIRGPVPPYYKYKMRMYKIINRQERSSARIGLILQARNSKDVRMGTRRKLPRFPAKRINPARQRPINRVNGHRLPSYESLIREAKKRR